MTLKTILLACVLAACVGCRNGDRPPANASAATPAAFTLRKSALDSLAARLSVLTDSLPAASIGFTVRHVESGQRVAIHGDERYFLASVFKFPIAVTTYARIEQGALRADSLVRIQAAERRRGVGSLDTRVGAGPIDVTVQEMLEAMLVESDNTACDRLLVLVGGPKAVEAHMKRIGEPSIRLARDERALGELWQRDRAAFLANGDDGGSPNGLAGLLVRVQRGEVLNAAHTRELLATMARAMTGKGRLRAGLPTGTVVAHKTGTWGNGADQANDVGLVTLPDGRGTLAIAAFVRGYRGDAAGADRAIATLTGVSWSAWTAP